MGGWITVLVVFGALVALWYWIGDKPTDGGDDEPLGV